MILSDATIKQMIINKELKVNPGNNQSLDDILENIACASLDLQLGNSFKFFPEDLTHEVILDPFNKNSIKTEAITVDDWEDIIIKPWSFLLWATKETFWLPANIVGRVEWRSSLWRLWLVIHVTAWFIDPWFGRDHQSTITLEIANLNTVPIIIRPWMRICQIAFETMDTDAELPYNLKKSAKYNGQIDPEESRLHADPTLNREKLLA